MRLRTSAYHSANTIPNPYTSNCHYLQNYRHITNLSTYPYISQLAPNSETKKVLKQNVAS